MAHHQRKTVATRIEGMEILLTDDGSRTLVSDGVSYHSASGALTETRHVYLQNSCVADRLARGQATRVLEVGLGIGMGLLVTLDAAITHDAPLEYVAIENACVPRDVIEQLQPQQWVSNKFLADQFLSFCDSVGDNGVYRCEYSDGQQATILVNDLKNLLCDLPHREQKFDAIYFDPFAPEHDSSVWSQEVFSSMHEALSEDGRLVTYCVCRQVRDTIAACGFEVQRTRGPQNGKREVLIGAKRQHV